MKYTILILMFIATTILKAQNKNTTDFTIDKITVAITNVEEMVAFYETVFKCDFKKNEVYGTDMYSGKLGELNILLCPNTLAGVHAEQNRQQFDFYVNNLNSVIENAKASGGHLQGDVMDMEKLKIATIVDPDGNSIVFMQKKK